MPNEKIIEQLRSLIDEAKTHFTDDGDDLIFRDDAAALIMAIWAIERLTPKKPAISNSGVYGVCPNCRKFLEQFEQSHGNIEIPHCKWCGQALDWKGSDKT